MADSTIMSELQADMKKVNDFIDEAGGRFKRIDDRFDRMEHLLQRLSNSIGALNQRTEQSQSTLKDRSPSIDGFKANKITTSLLLNRFTEIETTVDVMKDYSRIDQMEATMARIMSSTGLVYESPPSQRPNSVQSLPAHESFSQSDIKCPQEQRDGIDSRIFVNSDFLSLRKPDAEEMAINGRTITNSINCDVGNFNVTQIQPLQFPFSYPRRCITILSERQKLADSHENSEILRPHSCLVPLTVAALLPMTNQIEGTIHGLIVQWVFDPGSIIEIPYGLHRFAENEQPTCYRAWEAFVGSHI